MVVRRAADSLQSSRRHRRQQTVPPPGPQPRALFQLRKRAAGDREPNTLIRRCRAGDSLFVVAHPRARPAHRTELAKPHPRCTARRHRGAAQTRSAARWDRHRSSRAVQSRPHHVGDTIGTAVGAGEKPSSTYGSAVNPSRHAVPWKKAPHEGPAPRHGQLSASDGFELRGPEPCRG